MSQSQRSLSLSPAPVRNQPLSRDNSQSNRLTNSQSESSQSGNKSRSISPAPSANSTNNKTSKKRFKCPVVTKAASSQGKYSTGN